MIYAVAHLSITDDASFAAYREVAGEALAKHGGAVVQASRALQPIDGAPTLHDTVAVLSFPDAAAARGWIDDPELAEIHALRRGAGQSDIVVLS